MTKEKLKYSRNVLISLVEKKDDSKLLFDELAKIRGYGENKNKELAIKYINKLNNEFNIDIYLLAKNAIEEGKGWYNILDLIIDSTPKLKFESTSLLELLKLLNIKMQGDLTYGKQFDIVASLADHQPKKAFQFIEKLLENSDTFIIGNLTTLLKNLFKKYPDKVWNKTHSLVSNKKINVKKGAIISLGSFEYKLPRDKTKLKVTISKLKEIQNKENKYLNESLLIAYSQMIALYPGSTNEILKYSQKNDRQIHYQIASILNRNVSNYYNEKWFKESLLNISKVSCKDKGTLNTIDSLLGHFIDKNSNWDIVAEFIINWGINSDYNKYNEEKITEIFNSTFYRIFKNKEQLQKLLTLILNNDNHSIHFLLYDIASKLTMSNIGKVQLDLSILNTLGYVDLVYICRKILGYFYQADIPLYLTMSILKKSVVDEEIEKLVIDVIINFIGRNYTHTTIQKLKNMQKNKMLNKIQSRVAKIIIKSLDGYQKTINALPNLKELSISNKQRYRIELSKKKIMVGTINKAQKSSVISQITTNVPLKHGTSWFSYYNGEYQTTSPLQEISHSIELPKLEIINPVGSGLQRAQFRIANRGDK